MSKVLIPVVGTAVVYVISRGWLTAAWQSLYNMTHTGDSTAGPAPVTSLIPGASSAYPGAQDVYNQYHGGKTP